MYEEGDRKLSKTCKSCDDNERNEYGDRCMSCVPRLTLTTALKLQELVKERLPLLTLSMNNFKDLMTTEYNFQRAKVEILTELLEESEK